MFHAKMTATYLLHICESGYRRGVSWASVGCIPHLSMDPSLALNSDYVKLTIPVPF